MQEFERLRARDCRHLVLPELLKLRFSQVPLANLGVLWVLDRCGSQGAARQPPLLQSKPR